MDYEIEQQEETVKALKSLVKAFDCEEGLPEEVYHATYELLDTQLGGPSAPGFSRGISATDGRFYFKDGAMERALRKIFWMEDL